jgi:hypothetical protein
MKDILESAWHMAGTEQPFMFNPDDFAVINDNWPDGSDDIFYTYADGSNVLRMVSGKGEEIPSHYFFYSASDRRLTEFLNGEAAAVYSLDKFPEPTAAPTPEPTPTPSPEPSRFPAWTPSPTPTPVPVPVKTATLYAVFSEKDNLTRRIAHKYTGELTVFDLAKALSEATGLDFALSAFEPASDGLVVEWSPASTLIQGLGNRKPAFAFNSQDDLNWFMMDSLYYTLKENLGQLNIYYTSEKGDPLVVPREGGKTTFSKDTPYLGSAFYIEHAN